MALTPPQPEQQYIDGLNRSARDIIALHAQISGSNPKPHIDYDHFDSRVSADSLYAWIRRIGVTDGVDNPNAPPSKQLAQTINPLLQNSGTTLEVLHTYLTDINKQLVRQWWPEMQSPDKTAQAEAYNHFHDRLDALGIKSGTLEMYDLIGRNIHPRDFHKRDRECAMAFIDDMLIDMPNFEAQLRAHRVQTKELTPAQAFSGAGTFTEIDLHFCEKVQEWSGISQQDIFDYINTRNGAAGSPPAPAAG